MKKVILKIEGMSCSGCSNGLEKYLNKQEDIESASVNLVMETATITCKNTTSINNLPLLDILGSLNLNFSFSAKSIKNLH